MHDSKLRFEGCGTNFCIDKLHLPVWCFIDSSGNPAYNFTPVSGDGEEGGGELHLTGLRAYTRYTLVAQAVNQVGSGPLSEPLTTQTLEDGKPFLSDFFLIRKKRLRMIDVEIIRNWF